MENLKLVKILIKEVENTLEKILNKQGVWYMDFDGAVELILNELLNNDNNITIEKAVWNWYFETEFNSPENLIINK